MFAKLENLLFDIKNTLLNSQEIRQLLFYNTPDALSKAVPTVAEASPSIYIKPIIYIYDDSPEFGTNSFISIGIIEGLMLDGSSELSIKVSVAVDREIWLLDNNRIRSIALMDLAVNLLDNKKLGPAGKLEVKAFKEVYYNNDIVGYTLFIDLVEERGDVVRAF